MSVRGVLHDSVRRHSRLPRVGFSCLSDFCIVVIQVFFNFGGFSGLHTVSVGLTVASTSRLSISFPRDYRESGCRGLVSLRLVVDSNCIGLIFYLFGIMAFSFGHLILHGLHSLLKGFHHLCGGIRFLGFGRRGGRRHLVVGLLQRNRRRLVGGLPERNLWGGGGGGGSTWLTGTSMLSSSSSNTFKRPSSMASRSVSICPDGRAKGFCALSLA